MDKMIACCGLDCERCEAHKATVNDDNDLRKKVAKEWSELNKVTITPEMINCDGCRMDGRKTRSANPCVRSGCAFSVKDSGHAANVRRWNPVTN